MEANWQVWSDFVRLANLTRLESKRYYSAREVLTMSPPRLIIAACVALPFVFVSRLIFPGPSGAASLDDHFFAHRRAILAGLAASPLAAGNREAVQRCREAAEKANKPVRCTIEVKPEGVIDPSRE